MQIYDASSIMQIMKPQKTSYEQIVQILKENPTTLIHDEPGIALSELFDIHFPEKKDTKTQKDIDQFSKDQGIADLNTWGEWFIFPWSNRIVHFPPMDVLRKLRTSRNRNLITASEQIELFRSSILIAGMSVGSNVVEALVGEGIGGSFVLCDMDIIEPSNLNRIRSPYYHIGLKKTQAIAQKMWEIDPYLEIICINDGVNSSNISGLLDEYNVSVIVDEIDSLSVKISIREEAKKRSLAVVMAADDGEDSLVHIERYDIHPDQDIFHGLIPSEVLARIMRNDLSRPEIGMVIGKYFVGAENIPLRMFESLSQVGKTLPSWPQLGGAAALSGICIAYVVKKILLGEAVVEGRVLVSLDEKLDLEHKKEEHKAHLEKMIEMFSAGVDL